MGDVVTTALAATGEGGGGFAGPGVAAAARLRQTRAAAAAPAVVGPPAGPKVQRRRGNRLAHLPRRVREVARRRMWL